MRWLYTLTGAFLGSLGFGCMYGLRGCKLWMAALTGFGGQLACLLVQAVWPNDCLSMLAGSLCATLFSEGLARKLKTPAAAFLVCALIPLVPGWGIYETLRLWILASPEAGMWARTTFLQGCGIAAGCLVAAALVKTWKPRGASSRS